MAAILVFPSGAPLDIASREQQEATGFYSPADTARIARVPQRILYDWRKWGMVVPTLRSSVGSSPEQTGYTFLQVVFLRLLRYLRDEKVSLERSVRILRHLLERFGLPGAQWEAARTFVQGSDVFADAKDAWGATEATRGGQIAAAVLLGEEFALLRQRADALLVPAEF